ncbi:MAG: hypothetical protein IPP48_08395 [Chitinophagaceae bacterium]|nr:hypothetical protein [Chitinophagaceae bacterium]
MEKINNLIANKHKGNSAKAIAAAKHYFKSKFSIKKELNAIQEQIFEEVALWAYAHKIEDRQRLQLLYKIIFTKSVDAIAYNKLVLQVIDLS